MFETPVLFIIFNRPDRAQEVFDVIKEVQPKYLFVAADGPRRDRPEDIEKCENTRSIINQIDWDCQLKTFFSDTNKGCGIGPSSAISWFFENVNEGIILEDDCVAHPDFFPFCAIMLDRFRNDEKILSIAGSNFQDGEVRGEGSYYFSVHNRIWGWAAWRRTWQTYDYYIKRLDRKAFEKIVKDKFQTKKEQKYWMYEYDVVKKDRMQDSCWDYQFMFMLWLRSGLTVVPNSNLISNIGDDVDATHTHWVNNPNLRRKTKSLFPLIHNTNIKQDRKADNYYFKKYIYKKKRNFIDKVINKIRKIKRKYFN